VTPTDTPSVSIRTHGVGHIHRRQGRRRPIRWRAAVLVVAFCATVALVEFGGITGIVVGALLAAVAVVGTLAARQTGR
jgi:hypothetical protein